jgi:DNA-binding NtrC family response regulator
MNSSDVEASERCRTLIVEDDPACASLLLRILEMVGHAGEIAATVSEAIDKLEGGAECVLLDLDLPDGTGVEVLHEIRRRNLPVRVAIVTAGTDAELARAAMELKPDAFFQKPLDVSRVTNWLREVDRVA